MKMSVKCLYNTIIAEADCSSDVSTLRESKSTCHKGTKKVGNSTISVVFLF